MAGTDKTASFSVKLDSNASKEAAAAAEELAKLKKAILGGQDAIRGMTKDMRALKGSTDTVKQAKADLRKKIEGERDAILLGNRALKSGKESLRANVIAAKEAAKLKAVLKGQAIAAEQKAIDAAKEAAKLKAATEQKALDGAKARADRLARGFKIAGGPVADLSDKLGVLKETLGGTEGAMGLLGLAAAGAVVGIVAVTAGVLGAAAAFAKWAVEGANALRTMNLTREAMSGSAANAEALGSQVDALARKVPTSKDALNELGSEMARTFQRTTVSGQGIVDTFNLVAQSSSAMGDQVGRQLGDIVERGKRFGRLQINPFEMQGTGVTFEDVAGQLAKNLGIGIEAAKAQLFEGRTEINDGAKALRGAVEKNFSGINAKKLLDLDVIVMRFHEHLTALTKGINLEPLLEAVSKLSDLFDESTVSGAALKAIVTDFGNAFVESFTRDGVPAIQEFVDELVNFALKTDIAFLESKESILDFLGGFADMFTAKNLMIVTTGVVVALTAACVALAISTAEIWGPFVVLGAAVATVIALWPDFVGLFGAIGDAIDDFVEWTADLGDRIVEGIKNGILSAWHTLTDAVSDLAGGVKDAFKRALGISSPSKVFAAYGRQTVEGFSGGMDRSAFAAQASADAMAPGAPAGGGGALGGGASRGGGGVTVIFQVAVEAGAKGEEIKQALSAPSFLAQLTRAIEQAGQGMGIPTQAGAT